MKKYGRIGITAAAVFIWCGMIYPELAFPDDVLGIFSEADGSREAWTADAYYGLMQDGAEKIEIRSRLAEWIETIR